MKNAVATSTELILFLPLGAAMMDKDLEMLGEARSAASTDSINERIDRLKREIGRGEAVYSRKELHLLQRKLEEYEALLDAMFH
jgi:uncharacterized small protein (DUF1192 family)